MSDVKDEASAPWDVRILERIEAGVDRSLIEASLARTPTERLRLLQDRIRFLEPLRDDRP